MIDENIGEKIFDSLTGVLPFFIVDVSGKNVKVFEVQNSLKKRLGIFGFSNNAGIEILGKASDLTLSSGEKIVFRGKVYRIADVKDCFGGLRIYSLDDEY